MCGGGGGARVSAFFIKYPNLKNIYIYFFLWGGGGGEGGRWTDKRTGQNQLAPSTSLSWGHNNA